MPQGTWLELHVSNSARTPLSSQNEAETQDTTSELEWQGEPKGARGLWAKLWRTAGREASPARLGDSGTGEPRSCLLSTGFLSWLIHGFFIFLIMKAPSSHENFSGSSEGYFLNKKSDPTTGVNTLHVLVCTFLMPKEVLLWKPRGCTPRPTSVCPHRTTEVYTCFPTLTASMFLCKMTIKITINCYSYLTTS